MKSEAVHPRKQPYPGTKCRARPFHPRKGRKMGTDCGEEKARPQKQVDTHGLTAETALIEPVGGDGQSGLEENGRRSRRRRRPVGAAVVVRVSDER